jgi:PAS domain S-box-containing protein
LKGGVIVFHDITELKATQTKLEQTIGELRDKTQLMETVFDSMSEGIAVLNVTGQVVFVNPSIKQMLGTMPLDPLPSNWSETYGVFYPDKERHIPIDQFLSTHIFRGEAIRDREIFVHNEEQMEGLNVMASALPLFDENQQVIGCVAILRDITKSKVAEAQLEKTMQELRNQVQLTETVFNSISDGVVVTDEVGNFLLVNPSAERIVGMGPTDTPPDQWSETYGTFYPDKVTLFPSEELPLVHAMQGRVTDEVDLFIRNPANPEGCFINVTGRPLQDERNSVRGGVIVFRDVTKAKNAEVQLEQTVRDLEDQTQLMDIIFNNMSDGVVVADDKGQYIMSNPAAQQMIGRPLEELDLPRASEQYGIFHPTTGSLFPADQLPLARAIKGNSTNNIEMRINN